jgi:hypothetical protein
MRSSRNRRRRSRSDSRAVGICMTGTGIVVVVAVPRRSLDASASDIIDNVTAKTPIFLLLRLPLVVEASNPLDNVRVNPGSGRHSSRSATLYLRWLIIEGRTGLTFGRHSNRPLHGLNFPALPQAVALESGSIGRCRAQPPSISADTDVWSLLQSAIAGRDRLGISADIGFWTTDQTASAGREPPNISADIVLEITSTIDCTA